MFVMNVICTGEKYFSLNHKNYGTGSNECPHEIVESNSPNDQKVMLFAAIVDGKPPVVHPYVEENRRNLTLNVTGYLDFFGEEI